MSEQTNEKKEMEAQIQSREAGMFFNYMADFVGFGEDDKEAIKESQLIIEKHLPAIIAGFYVRLLEYPPTRKYFLKKDGSVDEDYLRLRMFHQSHFWRRVAGGEYDDDFAHFVDNVGRAHTSRGADPRIYIAERYVIAMVGFVQNAITEVLNKELREFDPDLETRATRAWNKICMVILELLARAYGHERKGEDDYSEPISVDDEFLMDMSVDAYEQGLGMLSSWEYKDFTVAKADEIPDGERKIVQVEGLSIGVFHHEGDWYAVRNHCLHRGGPVAAGKLDGDTLICPWHGFAYNVRNGCLLIDTNVKLETYPVAIKEGEVVLTIPVASLSPYVEASYEEPKEAVLGTDLKENEFLVSELLPGEVKAVEVDGEIVAVYNVEGQFYATQDECTHTAGPLSEGELDGFEIVCPWHASCFDVRDGSVTCGPAKIPLETYKVEIDGDIGRVVAEE